MVRFGSLSMVMARLPTIVNAVHMSEVALICIAGAASYLWWNSNAAGVEGQKHLRKDPLAEERSGMAAEGHEWKETSMRKLSRCCFGAHDGYLMV